MRKESTGDSVKIIFWGTSDFAVPALAALHKEFSVAAVVTNPDAPAGRNQEIESPPVKRWAEKERLPVLQPNILNDESFASELRVHNPDLFVVAAYGKIIPAPILSIAGAGALNIHPSLLPKFRGPSPIEGAILAGVEETGVSIMLMDEKMDHGPVLAQTAIPLAPSDTRITLTEQLAYLGADLLIKTIPGWIGGSIQPQAQDHDRATYAKILTRDDGRLFWDSPAKALERQVRAFLGWPGTYCLWAKEGKSLRLKIEEVHAVADRVLHGAYGTVWKSSRNPLLVQTLDGSLAVARLQLEGGKSQTASEFLRGHPDIIGAVLL